MIFRRRFVRLRAFSARVLRGVARRIELNPNAGQAGDQWVAPVLPDWVRDEILAMAHVDPGLVDADDNTSRYAFYSVPSNPMPGMVYSDLLD